MVGKMSLVVVADYETAAVVLTSKTSNQLSRLMRLSAMGITLGLFSTCLVRRHLKNKYYRSPTLLFSCLRLRRYLTAVETSWQDFQSSSESKMLLGPRHGGLNTMHALFTFMRNWNERELVAWALVRQPGSQQHFIGLQRIEHSCDAWGA